jgi:hypothetical protein
MTLNRILPVKTGYIPEDLAAWYDARNLVYLALGAVHDVKWPDPRSQTTFLSATPLQVLRTLLTYAYSRGVLSSLELESLCRRDPDFRYVCAGAYPVADEIRAFRRTNISYIQEVLAALLKKAFQDNNPPSGNISEMAREHAALRLRRAIQIDSIALDE